MAITAPRRMRSVSSRSPPRNGYRTRRPTRSPSCRRTGSSSFWSPIRPGRCQWDRAPIRSPRPATHSVTVLAKRTGWPGTTLSHSIRCSPPRRRSPPSPCRLPLTPPMARCERMMRAAPTCTHQISATTGGPTPLPTVPAWSTGTTERASSPPRTERRSSLPGGRLTSDSRTLPRRSPTRSSAVRCCA